MSDYERRSSATRTLDALVDEAKKHLDIPPPSESSSVDRDWSRLESRLVETEESRVSVIGSRRPRRSRVGIALQGAAVVLAAAAIVALFARPKPTISESGPVAEVEREQASSLRATEPFSGQVRVNGSMASSGYVVRAGDTIDVTDTRAIFERTRKVTWLLEQEPDGSRAPAAVKTPTPAAARVSAAGQPLVVGLEHGVVEAQVAPVSEGEAFAVDVATERGVVRVAVHGTHLRVARAGNHVVVDLTEGVIAIGIPPKSGMTTGTVVKAPAHVELDATDLASLRVDHAPESVRAAVSLPVEGLTKVATALSSESANAQPPHPTSVVSVAALPAKGPRPSPEDQNIAAPTKVEAPTTIASPRDAISAAVRHCAARVARPSEVRVTVTSNLRLRVSSTGVVESAQFTPPLLPEIQSCAAQAIYKTKLETETGIVTIPLEYSY
jgi:hypothetical protein